MQLKVRINFGPIESPTKTIPLIDLVDNLRVVLAALPFVSQASKEKAIDAMSNTNFDAELPSAEVRETSFSWMFFFNVFIPKIVEESPFFDSDFSIWVEFHHLG